MITVGYGRIFELIQIQSRGLMLIRLRGPSLAPVCVTNGDAL